MKKKRLVAVVVVAGVLVVVALGYALFGGSSDDVLADLQARVEASKARTWARPLPTPGWEALEGRAAADYQNALEACDISASRDDLRKLVGVLGEEAGTAAGDAVLAEECAAAGLRVPAGHPRLVDALTPEVCRSTVSCQDALLALGRGSRRMDMKSPINLWDEWAYPKGQLRAAPGFLALPLLRLVTTYTTDLARGDGDYAVTLDAIWSNLRFAQDFGRGGGLIGAMFGVAIAQPNYALLARLVAHGRLSPAQIDRGLDELVYLESTSVPFVDALAAEYLQLMTLYFDEGALPGIPRLSTPPPSYTLWERVFMHDAGRQTDADFKEVLSAGDRPLPERRKVYDAVYNRRSASWNPLVQIGTSSYWRFEVKVTAWHARRRLALLGLAHLASGRQGTSDEVLRRHGATLPVVDPLTNEEFVITRTAGVWRGRSAATMQALEDPVEFVVPGP
jgi:hypothetical protein